MGNVGNTTNWKCSYDNNSSIMLATIKNDSLFTLNPTLSWAKLFDGSFNQGEVTPIDSVQTPTTVVKNLVKQSKPKIWKVKRSKAHRKLEKVKGQAS